MPEYEVEEHPEDNGSEDSAHSLDREFSVPIMCTPGVKKALTSTNEKLRRSSRAKTQVTRSAYNEYIAHHYAFTMKVVAEQEPERPSLRHKLEGEKRPNHANREKEGQTTQSNAKAANRAKSRRKPKAARMSTEAE